MLRTYRPGDQFEAEGTTEADATKVGKVLPTLDWRELPGSTIPLQDDCLEHEIEMKVRTE